MGVTFLLTVGASRHDRHFNKQVPITVGKAMEICDSANCNQSLPAALSSHLSTLNCNVGSQTKAFMLVSFQMHSCG